MTNRTHPTPAQRLARALDGRELPATPIRFEPLDPATLTHLPRTAAVNPETLDHLTASNRVAALIGLNPEGTARLLADVDATGRLRELAGMFPGSVLAAQAGTLLDVTA